MKAANKAWFWLAAGVLALGLNGYYLDGGLQQIHGLADSALTTIAENRAHFGQAATLAEVTIAEGLSCERSAPASVVAVSPNIPVQAQARLAHSQERLGEMQAARVQARMARLQHVIEQRELRWVEGQDGEVSVVNEQDEVRLPQLPRVEVNVPQGPAAEVPQPN
jgi:hypothetical protein